MQLSLRPDYEKQKFKYRQQNFNDVHVYDALFLQEGSIVTL
jgi:hypothetical protein